MILNHLIYSFNNSYIIYSYDVEEFITIDINYICSYNFASLLMNFNPKFNLYNFYILNKISNNELLNI
jgi:hypothetical protein